MLFICKIFQNSLEVVLPVIVHVKTTAVFIMRVQQYLVKSILTTYVVRNASNDSFTFPQSSGKRSLH